MGPAGEGTEPTERSSEQQRREASHRGEERGATQHSCLDVGEGNEGRDDEDHDQRHKDQVVALALYCSGVSSSFLRMSGASPWTEPVLPPGFAPSFSVEKCWSDLEVSY